MAYGSLKIDTVVTSSKTLNLDSVLDTSDLASEAEAVAGSSSSTVMTPQRTLQAIQANPQGVSLGLAIALS